MKDDLVVVRMDLMRGVVEVEQRSNHPETNVPRMDTVLHRQEEEEEEEMDILWAKSLRRNSRPRQIQVMNYCSAVTEQHSNVDRLVGWQHNVGHRVVEKAKCHRTEVAESPDDSKMGMGVPMPDEEGEKNDVALVVVN